MASPVLLDLRCDGVHAPAVRVHAVVGDGAIQRLTHIHQLRELRAPIVAREQGTRFAAARAAELLFNRRFEIDDIASLRKVLSIHRVEHRAAARGEDDVLEPGQLVDHFALAPPEAGLAFLLEDI